MNARQFSIREVLLSVTFIAVGIEVLFTFFPYFDNSTILIWLTGWAMIGAGCGTPFRMKLFGALLGLCILLPAAMLVLSLLSHEQVSIEP